MDNINDERDLEDDYINVSNSAILRDNMLQRLLRDDIPSNMRNNIKDILKDISPEVMDFVTNSMNKENEQFEIILNGLKNNNIDQQIKISHLVELCELLSIRTEETLLLSDFKMKEFLPELIRLIGNDIKDRNNINNNIELLNTEIIILALQAINSIITIIPDSIPICVNNRIIPRLCTNLSLLEYIDTVETTLNVLKKIIIYNNQYYRPECIMKQIPIDIISNNGFVVILQYIEFFPMTVQHVAMDIVCELCSRYRVGGYNHIRNMNDETKLLDGFSLLQNLKKTIKDPEMMFKIVNSYLNFIKSNGECRNDGTDISQCTIISKIFNNELFDSFINSISSFSVENANESLDNRITCSIFQILRSSCHITVLQHIWKKETLEKLWYILHNILDTISHKCTDSTTNEYLFQDSLELTFTLFLLKLPENSLVQEKSLFFLPTLLKLSDSFLLSENTELSVINLIGQLCHIIDNTCLIYFFKTNKTHKKLVCKLVSRLIPSQIESYQNNGKQNSLINGFNLTIIFLKHCQEVFYNDFAREGIFEIITDYQNKTKNFNNDIDQAMIGESTKNTLKYQLEQLSHFTIRYKSQSSMMLDLLNKIADAIQNNSDNIRFYFKKLSQLLYDGLTAYEISRSNIIVALNIYFSYVLNPSKYVDEIALYDFLFGTHQISRIGQSSNLVENNMIEQNNNIEENSSYVALVKILQEALCKYEDFSTNYVINEKNYNVISLTKLNGIRIELINLTNLTDSSDKNTTIIIVDPLWSTTTLKRIIKSKLLSNSNDMKTDQKVNNDDISKNIEINRNDDKFLELDIKIDDIDLIFNGCIIYKNSSIIELIVHYCDGLNTSIWEKKNTICFRYLKKTAIQIENMKSQKSIDCNNINFSTKTENILLLLKNLYDADIKLRNEKRLTNNKDNALNQYYPLQNIAEDKKKLLFINNKLDNKIKNQLNCPLLLISNYYSKWFQYLIKIKKVNFLFSYETRQKFFYLDTFGTRRALHYLLSKNKSNDRTTNYSHNSEMVSNDSDLRLVPLPQVRSLQNNVINDMMISKDHISVMKAKVSRGKILLYGRKVFDDLTKHKINDNNNIILDFEFQGETGTGSGPSTEFYTLLCQEIQQKNLNIWRHDYSTQANNKIKTVDNTNKKKMYNILVHMCTKCNYVLFPVCPDHKKLFIGKNNNINKYSKMTKDIKNRKNTSSINHKNNIFACSENSCRSMANLPNFCDHCDDISRNNTYNIFISKQWVLSSDELYKLYQDVNRRENRNTDTLLCNILKCDKCNITKFMLDSTDNEKNKIQIEKHLTGCPYLTKDVTNEITVRRKCYMKFYDLFDLLTRLEETQSISNNALETNNRFVFSPNGLFPQPFDLSSSQERSRVQDLFTFIGRFVAYAIKDGRLLDLPLSDEFLRLVFFNTKIGNKNIDFYIRMLSCIDPMMANSFSYLENLRKKYLLLQMKFNQNTNITNCISEMGTIKKEIESLSLDFTLVQNTNDPESIIELKTRGKDIPVKIGNIYQYINLNLLYMLEKGIEPQIIHFQKGFNSVFSLKKFICIFTFNEIKSIFSSQYNNDNNKLMFVEDELKKYIECKHGYEKNSNSIMHLIDILTKEFNKNNQILFLRFVTGSSRLPVGGLKSLDPPLTVVRKVPEIGSADNILLSASTCSNYLKLPDYSTKEIMKEKLLFCIKEGQGSFHLS